MDCMTRGFYLCKSVKMVYILIIFFNILEMTKSYGWRQFHSCQGVGLEEVCDYMLVLNQYQIYAFENVQTFLYKCYSWGKLGERYMWIFPFLWLLLKVNYFKLKVSKNLTLVRVNLIFEKETFWHILSQNCFKSHPVALLSYWYFSLLDPFFLHNVGPVVGSAMSTNWCLNFKVFGFGEHYFRDVQSEILQV